MAYRKLCRAILLPPRMFPHSPGAENVQATSISIEYNKTKIIFPHTYEIHALLDRYGRLWLSIH